MDNEKKKVRGFQLIGFTDDEWNLLKKKCNDIRYIGSTRVLITIILRQFLDDDFEFEFGFDKNKQKIIIDNIKQRG
jgi:hypothetical protein